MPRLGQRGAIQFLVLLILLGGIIVGVYLITSGPLKLFPRAASGPLPPPPPSVFGQAISLSGTQQDPQYISIPYTSIANAQANFTIEAWIKPNLATTTQYGAIVAKSRSAVGDDAYKLSFVQEPQSDGKYRYHYEFYAQGKRSTDTSCIGPTAYSNSGTIPGDNSQSVTADQVTSWKHVVGEIRDGSLYIYENGRKVADRSDWKLVSFCNSTAPLQIGAGLYSDNVPSLLFNGLIDEVRISVTARYSSDFSVPTVPFSSDGNTLVLYHLDGNAYDSASSSAYNGQVIGNAQFVDSTIGVTSSPSPTPTPTPTPTPDTQKPTVTITNPKYNSVVTKGSTVNVTADASDNVGVTKVEFYANNKLFCTDTTSAYSCSVNILKNAPASIKLSAKAYDGAGNNALQSILVKTQ